MRMSVMGLVGAPSSRANRKLKRPPKVREGEGASRAKRGGQRGHGARGVELSTGRGRGRRRGRGGVLGAFQRLGAVVWPERFPELAAERARARVSRPAPRGFIWVWGVALTLAVAAFVMHLHVRFEIIQTGYALSNAQAEQRRLRLSQRELRLELATLKEPGRIEEQARTMLGMERPDHDRIVRLDGRGRRSRGRRR